MKPITAVVVGAGGISNAWFPPLAKEQVRVAAVVDLRVEAARQQIAKYQLDAEATSDLRGALRRHRPDFVVDLTVPEAHATVTCTALRAGCHVIGEKPMAASMAAARRMVRTAAETGRLYMVSQSRRWDAKVVTAQRLAHNSKLGRLTTVNCDFYIGAHFGGFRDEMASPLLLDMAIHHFDLARYLTGKNPVAVYAHEFNPAGSWYRGNAAASVIFEMTDGVVFTYRGSWCAEGYPTSWNGDWRLIGEQGTVIYAADQMPRCEVVVGNTGFRRPTRNLTLRPVNVPAPMMHGALQEMLAFLRTGKKPQTECGDNIQSLAMVFAAIASAKAKRRVPVRVM